VGGLWNINVIVESMGRSVVQLTQLTAMVCSVEMVRGIQSRRSGSFDVRQGRVSSENIVRVELQWKDETNQNEGKKMCFSCH